MHGPTFMANPLATAVSLASVKLLLSQPWQATITNIEQQLRTGLEPAKAVNGVADVRVLGSIGVIEMEKPVQMAAIQQQLVNEGIWLRPFGKLVYTIPPYIISDQDLKILTSGLVRVVKQS